MPANAKLAHKIRSGALTVTIWKNESDSFGFDDSMTLAKLTWILVQQAGRQAA